MQGRVQPVRGGVRSCGGWGRYVEIVAVVGGALVDVGEEADRPQYSPITAAVAPFLPSAATKLERRIGSQRGPLSVQPAKPEDAAERTHRPQELAAAWHKGVLLHLHGGGPHTTTLRSSCLSWKSFCARGRHPQRCWQSRTSLRI